MIEFATALTHALNDAPLPPLGLSQVEYRHPIVENTEYYSGIWWVSFLRVHESGHTYPHDGATLQISEDYGPLLIGLSLGSEVRDIAAQIISRDQALEFSRAHAEALLKWEPVKSQFAGYVLEPGPTARRALVHPNYILDLEDPSELEEATRNPARLAWVVTFAALLQPPFSASEREASLVEVIVWIDITDGEFLGGDFR